MPWEGERRARDGTGWPGRGQTAPGSEEGTRGLLGEREGRQRAPGREERGPESPLEVGQAEGPWEGAGTDCFREGGIVHPKGGRQRALRGREGRGRRFPGGREERGPEGPGNEEGSQRVSRR